MGLPFHRLGWFFHRYSHRAYPDWAVVSLRGMVTLLPPGASVLDLGGGTGVLTRFAHEARPDLAYTVVDPAAGMLRYVPDFAGKRQAQAENLPFEPASFDAVMIGEALHHFRDVDRALDEVMRVLRVGGWLWIYEFDPTVFCGRLLRFFERLLGEPGHFFEPDRLVQRLGERSIVGDVLEEGCRYVFRGERREVRVPRG